ncbi:YcaO-like family protein [Oligoflexus tunisiensis]|uniref:YcaO-like family protein n=1 Tax=Oligoflexus tunisiensis TaxID=708132 RepID=UPI00114D0815|nr:YcaO-like family protein [Oligoflexus tunisiensis]
MNKPLEAGPQLELAPGWTLIDALEETRMIADCRLHLRGYACQRAQDQKVITGSWAGWNEPSLDIAQLELQERLALMRALDQPAQKVWPLLSLTSRKIGFTSGAMLFQKSPDPEHMQYAKSNGVALGVNFRDAVERAACEVVERHLVLASWYGALRPQGIPMNLPAALESLQGLYEFRLFDFGSFLLKDLGSIQVRGCFLWPRHPGHPPVYGFGAALDSAAAMHKALGEAVQRLAFLDPLEVPTDEPQFTPTPDFHQEYFLHPARRPLLEAWLNGAPTHPTAAAPIKHAGEALAVDLTPEGSHAGVVVRVTIPGTLPLVFGRFQPSEFPQLPACLWIHPVV